MSLRLRVLSLFLAVLPLLWAFCPCCLAGAACGGDEAASCPCCPRDDAPGDEPPKDCEDCAATLARAGASPVTPDVALPGIEAAGMVVPAAVSTVSEVDGLLVRSDGPAPPDPTLAAISTVV